MQNYKVEVKNHGESIEAQELFFNLGYSWFHKKFEAIEIKTPETIMCFENGALTTGIRGSAKHKQITLQELRDMVAQKQKEYLVKTDTGYVLQVLSDVVDGHGGIIEVPDGVEVATENKEGLIYFWKNNGNDWFSRSHKKWKKLSSMQHHIEKLDHKIIWQRKESLNDQVASAEEYRQIFTHTPKATLDLINNIQNAFDKAQCAINAQNAMAKLFTYPQYLSGVAHGKEFILNLDQKKDESESVNSGQNIVDYLVDSSKSNGFSEGGFIPKSNHSIPAGLVDHGFSGFTQPEELPFIGLDTKFATEYQAEFFRKDDELDGDLCVEYVENAWNTQIGGDHYKKLAIQPMEYALQNKLDYAQANVVKYVTRHADKNGKQDLLKAIHNIELMIAHYYSDQE